MKNKRWLVRQLYDYGKKSSLGQKEWFSLTDFIDNLQKNIIEEQICNIQKYSVKQSFKLYKAPETMTGKDFDKNLIEYCIEDGYINEYQQKSTTRYIRVSSKGYDFIQWHYYPKLITNHWSFKHAVSFLIGVGLGLLLEKLLNIKI